MLVQSAVFFSFPKTTYYSKVPNFPPSLIWKRKLLLNPHYKFMLESLNSRKFESSIFQIRVRQTQDVVDATSTRPSDDFALPTSPISGLDGEAATRPLFNDEAAERNRAIQVFH